MHSPTDNRVVAIGGLGGSGTRVVAKVLQDLGVFIGDDLNDYLDNLIFVRLFKDPVWRANASTDEIQQRIKIFDKLMTQKGITISDAFEMMKYAWMHPSFQSNWRFYAFIMLKVTRSKRKFRSHWGWKEPNTFIYHQNFNLYFGDRLKYIHVIRHGLDMAFSDNKQQLSNWGHLFGIDLTHADDEQTKAQKQLEYWVKTTKAMIKWSSEQNSNSIYFLKYDQLIDSPKVEVKKLLDFIGIQVSENKINDLVTGIVKPKSIQRYKLHHMSIFPTDHIDYVKELGFGISQNNR